MDEQVDYTQYSESELVEMFGRMDPRYAPEQCDRLGRRLTELGYVVTRGELEPGYAVPTPSKLEALIGLSTPFECAVNFGGSSGAFSLEPAANALGFAGPGTLKTNGIFLDLTGRRAASRGLVSSAFDHFVQLTNRRITNVESDGSYVRFEYGTDGVMDAGAVTLQVNDESIATALVAVLPKTKSKSFQGQIKENVEFEKNLVARSPKPTMTYVLIAINALVFIAMMLDGGNLLGMKGSLLVDWGSNFGPYTHHGQWWRLLTSLFVHLNVLHILSNMMALWYFGPLIERLYGSAVYLFLYIVSGVVGALVSISLHPAVNTMGASGAICGILGAMLALMIRAGAPFPMDILRPIRHTLLVYLGWILYASFRAKGVDYAAHLGGFGSGLLLGLFSARLINKEHISAARQISDRDGNRGTVSVTAQGAAGRVRGDAGQPG